MDIQLRDHQCAKRRRLYVYVQRTLREERPQRGDQHVGSLPNYFSVHSCPGSHKLGIFCDNRFSRNKNNFLFLYPDNLCARDTLDQISINYPIPGHSYMPIDRTFALIEENRPATEKVPRPGDWVCVVRTPRVAKPFKICALNFALSSDLRAQPGIEVIKTKDFKTACCQRLKENAVAIPSSCYSSC